MSGAEEEAEAEAEDAVLGTRGEEEYAEEGADAEGAAIDGAMSSWQ
jgi:hypothetical protein